MRAIAATAAGVALTIAVVTMASAQDATIVAGSATAGVGQEAAVNVDALGIPDPGLGAWTVDITYDPSVVTPVACIPDNGGVCNPSFSDTVVRITGASASGLPGDSSLGSITFRCEALGTSSLAVAVPLIVDSTVGDPQPLEAGTQDGSVTCDEGEDEEPTPTPSTGGEEDTFDCTDFTDQAIAQAILDSDPSDPHNLDPDGNGIACDELLAGDDVDLPVAGSGINGGVVTSGEITRWLMAAFAGLGLATAGGIALMRWRASEERARHR